MRDRSTTSARQKAPDETPPRPDHPSQTTDASKTGKDAQNRQGVAKGTARPTGGRGSCQAANLNFASQKPHPTAEKRPAQVELRPPRRAVHSGTLHKGTTRHNGRARLLPSRKPGFRLTQNLITPLENVRLRWNFALPFKHLWLGWNLALPLNVFRLKCNFAPPNVDGLTTVP